MFICNCMYRVPIQSWKSWMLSIKNLESLENVLNFAIWHEKSGILVHQPWKLLIYNSHSELSSNFSNLIPKASAMIIIYKHSFPINNAIFWSGFLKIQFGKVLICSAMPVSEYGWQVAWIKTLLLPPSVTWHLCCFHHTEHWERATAGGPHPFTRLNTDAASQLEPPGASSTPD